MVKNDVMAVGRLIESEPRRLDALTRKARAFERSYEDLLVAAAASAGHLEELENTHGRSESDIVIAYGINRSTLRYVETLVSRSRKSSREQEDAGNMRTCGENIEPEELDVVASEISPQN
jgi:reverse gyrase